MKKILLTFLITIVFIVTAFSQDNKTGDYAITNEGETIYFYGESITKFISYIEYLNQDGKKKVIKIKDIKLLVNGNRLFLSVPITKSKKNLQEVVAFSDKYILTAYTQEIAYLYVFDREYNLIEDKTFFNPNGKRNIDENIEKLKNNISKYFTKCPQLLESLVQNIQNLKLINNDIAYYNCGNAPDLLTGSTDNNKDKVIAKKESGPKYYGVTKTGEKIIFDGKCTMSKNKVWYYLPGGKRKAANLSSFSIIVNGPDRFLWLPVSESKDEFMRIIGFNDKYAVTVTLKDEKDANAATYYLSGVVKENKLDDVHVYDKSKNLIEGNIPVSEFRSRLKKYFGDCDKVFDRIESNMKQQRSTGFLLNYVNCNEAEDFLKLDE